MRKGEWNSRPKKSEGRGDRPGRPPPRDRFRPGASPDGPAILYGIHTVKAALENPKRRIRRLLTTENALRRLREDGAPITLEPEMVRPGPFNAFGPREHDQGVLAEADSLPALDVEDIEEGLVLVLDQITDPHNVGAIFRTAAAFAATAIVTTARHSPEATGVLAKAASGALELVPLVTVQNLSRGLAELKERGFLLVGLDSSGDSDLAATSLRAPLALVLGAEGKGLRQLTRETCDYVARLDMPGAIKSLNVSNAAALAMYVATTRLK